MIKKHIVFTWELGGGLGHIAGFSPLAKALLKEGYVVSIVSKNVSSAAKVFTGLPIKVYQSPLYRNISNKLDVTYSYSEILIDLGYKSIQELEPLVSAWKNIFTLLKPDLVIADHSPTALLACRILDIKKITIGTGFFSPPKETPLPLFVGTNLQNQDRLVQHEKQVLDVINHVLKNAMACQLKHLFQIFEVEDNFLCTFKELDHYPQRNPTEYWGPRFNTEIGEDIIWPEGKGAKVFAYIKENTANFEQLFNALLNGKKNVLMYIPEASNKIKGACLSHKNIQLLDAPANMQQVLEQADLIVCHAGHGVVSAGLMSGKRLLLIPTQLEQSMLTYLLAKRRLVTAVNPQQPNVNYARAIEFACSNPELGQNIEAFKGKYAEFDANKQVERMLKSCVKLLAD